MPNKTTFKYPLKDKDTDNVWQIPTQQKIANAIKSIIPRQRKKRRDQGINIWPFNNQSIKPLSDNDMPAIFLVHDDLKMMPSFLKHYRTIGVTRFICVDDKSTDGTTEFLSKQSDVDLYQSNVRYGQAYRGKAWREMLAEKYGKNRWYLNLDSDEYLFTGYENNTTILEYAQKLKALGILRLPAPMIDMIPQGALNQAIFDGKDETMPWEIATHFDATGYEGKIVSSGLHLRGGARRRIINAEVDLMKYPLIYWDDKTSMGSSIHAPKPSYRNFAPLSGCLLHFKIFSDTQEVAQKAVEDKQYFSNAKEYERMNEYFLKNSDKELLYENSIKFNSVEDLIEHGFIFPHKKLNF